MDAVLGGTGLDLASDWGVFWICATWTFLVVTLIWLIGLFQPTHSMMDGWYGFGYASATLIAYLLTDAPSPTAAVVLLMALLHGGRLGFYLSKRWYGYTQTTGGDLRYFGFREKLSPGYWWKSFFMVMEPQALVLAIIGIPSVWGIIGNRAADGPIGPLGFLGMLIFGIGYYFETVGDGQLQAFKADPNNKGRYLRVGVWTHSRHPNYFGNTTVWWGIWLTAAAGNPSIWWTVIGPVTNTIMLTGVLGRAFQDKHMGVRPEYKKVMAETRGFLPLTVKKR